MPLSILSKNPESQSDHEKNTRETQTEGPSTKYQTGTPQNCQSHENQDKTEKLSQTRGGEHDSPVQRGIHGVLEQKQGTNGRTGETQRKPGV